jgi:N-acyl-phosphatidylethanolamine-hydrolysing phospholipase D
MIWGVAGAAAAAGGLQLIRSFRASRHLSRSVSRLPAHHDPAGGFRNPWSTADSREGGGFWRWQRERRQKELAPNPSPEQLPLEQFQVAYPHAAADEIRITWVGHATFLIQIGGANILTDPHWSRRASPVQFAGPSRLVEPGIPWDELPPIDAVLISHDHYDHLDSGTVRRIHRTFGDSVRWFTPLGFASWFAKRNVTGVREMDWWDEAALGTAERALRIVALPCQHWTSRTPWDRQRKLWASWAIITRDGRAVYFGGDSGYFPAYPEIRERVGSFDALLLPIGAYDPRWFMRPVHMNPEEAVQAYRDLGGEGTMIGMHWGTWRLTDEDPLEPPVRLRRAWTDQGLSERDLQILRHGGTWIG